MEASFPERALPDKAAEYGDLLIDRVNSGTPDDPLVVWIYFRDRGGIYRGGLAALPLDGGISMRARRRMERRSSPAAGRQVLLPVSREYIDSLEPHVIRIRHRSRYFNAVSVEARTSALEQIASLPWVERIDLVRAFRGKDHPSLPEGASCSPPVPGSDPLFDKYGQSLAQLEMIGADDLLERGYNGSGSESGTDSILICVMDSGFDLSHEVFSRIDVRVQYDFVDHDSVTSFQPGDPPGQDEHGTLVLGAIAGYHWGDLIGPAWGAQYLLAKTEIIDREIRIEEDNWVAGIEWADREGADIVSSSLGYILWYPPDSLDGESALCTRAADIAASNGVVVVNCAGNSGYGGLIAPADGDSVITVGAVDLWGNIAGFSSRGPTADGRIKPDLVAPGVNVHTVSYSSSYGYSKQYGTSFSTPLVAGLCAQLLEIHPQWAPMTLRDSLIAASSRADVPDNSYGYGIPDGLRASGLSPGGTGGNRYISRCYPNPFQDQVYFDLFFPQWEMVSVNIYDCRGALIRVLLEDRFLKWSGNLIWDGRNNAGKTVAGGVYFVEFVTMRERKTTKVIRVP